MKFPDIGEHLCAQVKGALLTDYFFSLAIFSFTTGFRDFFLLYLGGTLSLMVKYYRGMIFPPLKEFPHQPAGSCCEQTM